MVTITNWSLSSLHTATTTTILLSPIVALSVFCTVLIADFITQHSSWANSWRHLLQVMVSFYLISTVVFISGGPHSPLVFLYLPIVAEASILSARTWALGISTAIIASLYGMAAWGDYSLFWSQLPLDNAAAPIVASALVPILVLAIALVFTAYGAASLKRAASSMIERLDHSRRELALIETRQQTILEGIQDAVIMTDSNGGITAYNRPTEIIFGAAPGTMPTGFEDLLRRCRAKSSGPLTLPEFDLEIPSANGQESSRLRVHGKRMANPTGQAGERIYICRDITKLRSMEGQLEIQERLARMLAERESAAIEPSTKLDKFVGESKVMQRIFKLITRAAPTDATVLVNGESGTGKELVAKALHRGGSRSKGPFVPVNCGAIPEALLESELFGHKKGAFTGADSDAQGLFRKAHGGTLFLDEIGELPLTMQVKLLRALQEKTVHPVGGDLDIPIDVRVVAATNRNLRAEVAAGRFREDLYYRLNVINIQLPALRDRKEDIPLLISAALRRLVRAGAVPVVTPAAMQMLLRYTYPGNVRELENILERALVLGGEVILAEHLPEHLQSGDLRATTTAAAETVVIETEGVTLPVALDDILHAIEQRYIQAALTQARGGKKRAAELLGINFRSFRYRVQKFTAATPSDISPG